MSHCQMASGVHYKDTSAEIKPQKFEFFYFHNSFMTGLSGEMFFDHKDMYFRVGFSNPLVGKCKGLVDVRDAKTDNPYSQQEKKAGDCLKRANDNSPQKMASVETRYLPDNFPPIYTIVINQIDG